MPSPRVLALVACLVVIVVGATCGALLSKPGPNLRVTQGPTATPPPTSPAALPNTVALYVGGKVNGDFFAGNGTDACAAAPCATGDGGFPVVCTQHRNVASFGYGFPSSASVVDPRGNTIAPNWAAFAANGSATYLGLSIFWTGCTDKGTVAQNTCSDFTSIDGDGEIGGLYFPGLLAFDAGQTSSCTGLISVLCGCYQP